MEALSGKGMEGSATVGESGMGPSEGAGEDVMVCVYVCGGKIKRIGVTT